MLLGVPLALVVCLLGLLSLEGYEGPKNVVLVVLKGIDLVSLTSGDW